MKEVNSWISIESVCTRKFYFIASSRSDISKYCKVMKEVIRKEPETPSNVMGKKIWHLNYILPSSDKGNLTYLQEQRGLASTTWTPECGPITSRQAWSYKRLVHGVLSLLLLTALGDTANMVNSQSNCSIRGWKTSPGARRSTLCRSAQSIGPLAISWPLLKASKGNT